MSLASDEAREYEALAQSVYQAIVARSGLNIEVQHNVRVQGRSGVWHQCDVLWTFEIAALRHTVIVECKNYGRAVSLEHVRAFSSVVEDVPGAQGVMVTKVGFQAGAADFAKFKCIAAKVLRAPQTSDWEGRVQRIRTRMVIKWFDETEHRIHVLMQVALGTTEAYERLSKLDTEGLITYPQGPQTRLCDADGAPTTEEFGWWVPSMVHLAQREPGGPYVERVDTPGLHVVLSVDGRPEVWPLKYVEITYYVKVVADDVITVDAMDLVSAVLENYTSGEIEHFHRK